MKRGIVIAGLLLFALLWGQRWWREPLGNAFVPEPPAEEAASRDDGAAPAAAVPAHDASPLRPAHPTDRSGRPSPAPTNAPGATAEIGPAPADVPPAGPTNLPLPRFVGGHRANVPPGGALVVGGWPQPGGNRLLMFASPRLSDDGRTITVGSRFLSLPPARLANGGWERFMTDAAVAKEGGVFTAHEYRELLQAIADFDDVDVLSAPSLTTLPGQLATVEIMAERIEQVDGKPVLKKDGLTQGIIARQIDGSNDIDLAVTAAQFDSGAKNP